MGDWTDTPMKKDLFAQCFEDAKKAQPQVTNTQVQEIFCKVCKNRECGRAEWASTSWESRISTQVDRLILNPNIVPTAKGTRWEGLSNFEGFVEPNTIEVWGKETEPLVLIDSRPTPPQPQPTQQAEEPRSIALAPNKAFNTPPPKDLYIGGSTPTTSNNHNTIKDPWASPAPTLKVGGTFKMGK